MWSYYGNKSKLVNKYPPPRYDRIIEPFAGTARYALKYGADRDVTLVDAYDVIVKIWRYLIQASKREISKLPELRERENP